MPLMVTPFLIGCGKTYHVTFTSDDIKLSEKDYKENEAIVAPEDPTKSGYDFEGWFDGETKYEVGLKATKNYNFAARFEQIGEQCTVNFYEKDGLTLITSTVATEKNPIVTCPSHEVEQSGYVGKWAYSYLTFNIYCNPNSQFDLSGYIELLDEINFIWDELQPFSAKFYYQSVEQSDLTINFTKADSGFTLPDGVTQDDNYAWYDDSADKYYNPGEKIQFSPLDPSSIKNYAFTWKETPTQYTFTFYRPGKQEIYTTIIVTPSDATITPPLYDGSNEGYWWDEIYSLQLTPGAQTTIPPEGLNNYNFEWIPTTL